MNMHDKGITTAAVCVYPARVADAVKALKAAGCNIPVASVATGFPAAQTPLKTKLEEIRIAVEDGAREIDIVINRTLVLTGQWEGLYEEIHQFRQACGDAHMKTILGTGELGSLTNVYKASMVAMMAGFKRCDCCKWPMPISDLHVSCLSRICKSFKLRTKKQRDIHFRALLMESVLTPAPEQRFDLAPNTAASARSVPLVPSMSQPAPTKKPKKSVRGRSPTSHKGKERAGGKPRPLLCGLTPPSGSWAPAHVEQSSPSYTMPATQDSDEGLRQLQVLSMPKALQAVQEILTLPSLVAREQWLLARHPALKAAPHQQQCRSKGGNTIPRHPYFCAAADSGTAFRAGLLATQLRRQRCRQQQLRSADFIKTSTGKEAVNATLPVGIVMVRAVRDFYWKTGNKVGFKPAGGIRSAKDALTWLILMKEELGDEWLKPDLFRLGASTLLSDIERQIYHHVTGRYAAYHDLPMA
ncbi:Putative deoxyribose-phosphate aldolase [Chelonia mydas]|uniref:deoxyribose-phosphate aldolase n=1 Tax=Chelonia mydas TaxID=8469 RepID=M7BHE8_CHEMY|nr:Putative deoxyribose-phosphate aldolase [Chelonia mydas]